MLLLQRASPVLGKFFSCEDRSKQRLRNRSPGRVFKSERLLFNTGIGFCRTALSGGNEISFHCCTKIIFASPVSALPARGNYFAIHSRHSQEPQSSSRSDRNNRRTCR